MRENFPRLPILTPPALRRKADAIRKDVVDVCVRNGAGHIAPSLSCVDILTVLYYRVLRISRDPRWEGRDRLIFSKAHGGYALYSILTDLGYIDRKDWESFYRGSFLSGCVSRSEGHGLEAGCGALGHGLPIAVGIAWGAKLRRKGITVYCVVGDGEMQEGSNWEALQFAAKHGLSNLVLVVDANDLQAMDFVRNVLSPKDAVSDLKAKLAAFGLDVRTCDGHDATRLLDTFAHLGSRRKTSRKPGAVIARTIKGYGLRCMENVPKFHFRLPTAREMKQGRRYP